MQQVRAIRLGDPCVVSLKFEQRSNYISKSSIPRAQATRHSSFGIGVRERSTQNRLRVRASEENKGNNSGIDTLSEGEVAPKAAQKGQSKGVNLFDPAATLSRAVTRRFGLAGGLAFVALLASTEGYEIIKALLERDEEGDFEPMETDSGLIYKDSKVGGGPNPKNGDFVAAAFLIKDEQEVLFDTKTNGKSIAFTFGKNNPIVCAGVQEGMSTMRRGGVRELTIPPKLGYGAQGILPNGKAVPPGSTLTVLVKLEEVTGSYL